MKAQRIWIEIVLLGSAIALALALFLATIGMAAGMAEGRNDSPQSNSGRAANGQRAASEGPFEGMVTCSRCGARHAPELQRPATICVRVCVHGGAKFALVGPDSNYLLDGDFEALKRVAGERARIRGNLRGNTISVRSVTPET